MNVIILCCCLEHIGDNPDCPEHGQLYKRNQAAIVDNPICAGCGHPQSVHPGGVCFVTLLGGSICPCSNFRKE